MASNPELWYIYRAAYSHMPLNETQVDAIKGIYSCYGRDVIIEAVKKKKLIPAVAALMCRLDIEADFWRSYVEYYDQRNRQVIKCLDEMYRLLSDNDITKIVVVENFGALLASTQALSMFGSGDLDQYADPSERERIYKVLRNNGYTVEEVRVGNICISSSIRKANSFPEGFCFGINWDITNRVNLPSFTTRGDFIDWDRCMFYKDTSIRLPSPEGLMYVCLMHIAVHGFCKAPDIRLYYDIANAAQQTIDWNLLIQFAERDENEVKIAVAAYLAYKLLGVDIPSHVFDIGNKRQKQKLLEIVYDEKENMLKDFPSRTTRVLIDVFSDERGSIQGLFRIFFPKYIWIKEKYGAGVLGYVKHLLSMF